MNAEMNSFVQACEKVSQQVQNLLLVEREKRQALLQHDEVKLEEMVQTQQAMVMQLSSLESKRDQAQTVAGFQGRTGEQILQLVDADVQAVLQPVLGNLRQTTEELRNLNHISLEIAAAEMRYIERITGIAGDETKGIYNASGKRGSSSTFGSAFQEKI